MKDDVQKLRKMLQDLRDLRTTGFVDEVQYAENVERLERRLLDAVMNEGAPAETLPAPAAAARVDALLDSGPRPSRSSVWPLGWGLLATVSVLVLVGAGGWWAASRLPAGDGPSTAGIAGLSAAERAGMTPEQLTASAETLSRRLATRPQDAEGWAALARLHAAAGRHPDAAAAFEKAVALRDTDAALLVDFAEARAVANNGTLAGEPTQLLQRALGLEPANLQALSLAGTAAFDRKDYAAAVAYWDKIVEVAPADDPRALKARSSLGEARRLSLLPATPAVPVEGPTARVAAAAPTPSASAAGISGTITLASSLASRARPTDTLFVYARAVGGPAVPLAVIRKQVKDLPLNFRLDDSMSMWPAAKVSGFPQVVVTARVSKSGDGQPQEGDLQGQSPPVAAGATGLRIEIEKLVGPGR